MAVKKTDKVEKTASTERTATEKKDAPQKKVKKTRESSTKPTDVPVEEFLKTVDQRRRDEAHVIIDMMREISGEEPVMWGPSIIGFGKEAYSSESGCYGEVPKIAFSPRKTALTMYFNAGFHEYGSLMDRLGKYKTSVSCLYINKLKDVDPLVLKEMIEITWRGDRKEEVKEPMTPEKYIQSVPEKMRPSFLELRERVRRILPEAEEVISYGILGFKTDKRRAKVYISGFKDHLGLYPVPNDTEVQKELAPYLKGKGTLWLTEGNPISDELLRKYIETLLREDEERNQRKTKAKKK